MRLAELFRRKGEFKMISKETTGLPFDLHLENEMQHYCVTRWIYKYGLKKWLSDYGIEYTESTPEEFDRLGVEKEGNKFVLVTESSSRVRTDRNVTCINTKLKKEDLIKLLDYKDQLGEAKQTCEKEQQEELEAELSKPLNVRMEKEETLTFLPSGVLSTKREAWLRKKGIEYTVLTESELFLYEYIHSYEDIRIYDTTWCEYYVYEGKYECTGILSHVNTEDLTKALETRFENDHQYSNPDRMESLAEGNVIPADKTGLPFDLHLEDKPQHFFVEDWIGRFYLFEYFKEYRVMAVRGKPYVYEQGEEYNIIVPEQFPLGERPLILEVFTFLNQNDVKRLIEYKNPERITSEAYLSYVLMAITPFTEENIISASKTGLPFDLHLETLPQHFFVEDWIYQFYLRHYFDEYGITAISGNSCVYEQGEEYNVIIPEQFPLGERPFIIEVFTFLNQNDVKHLIEYRNPQKITSEATPLA